MALVVSVLAMAVAGLNLASNSSNKKLNYRHPLLNELQKLPPKSKLDNVLKTIPASYKDEKWVSGGKPMADILSKETKNLLIVIADEPNAPIEKLLEIIRQSKELEHIAISSPSLKTLTRARKLEPQLLYSAHQNHILQLGMMSTLFLQSMASTRYDFVILKNKNDLSQRASDELRQRDIPILLK